MEWLNYHHLLYFWVVAREGGLVPAGRVLHLSHPTLSSQIHALERHLGEKLFAKTGRNLTMTEMGRVVYRYAEEIFTLGREMSDVLKGRKGIQPTRLDVGVVDTVPKLIVRRLLKPVLHLSDPVRLVCHEDDYDKLLANLALHSLDIVIVDSPVPSGSKIKVFNHYLGDCGVTFFASERLARKYRRGFPESLDGAPFLLPVENMTLRRSLNLWFETLGVRPRVVAEFEDNALLNIFGADGLGIFPVPSLVERETKQHYGGQIVGRTVAVKERFYAISLERKLKNPAAQAISDGARHWLIGT